MSSWSPFDGERYTMSQQLILMVCSIINCILFGIIPVVMGPCLGLACARTRLQCGMFLRGLCLRGQTHHS